ncbi:PREDICTED: LOW QUALITY PROTEIN: meiotic recombination protein REC8 homolog [Dipodomys ordii]|uniref:LOW QUALITY PROTEIN: meiotic recombination protein REC8 homolog n=1 Tax=Dipodomys ordii TaxID=10020 RepID=A0A1S3FY59_DIPOR|nr:PREDICTED: LOW QUALITY PROTEIN: meiotic recombination protein REC8 homolog [Dipodomys ordii]
MFYYPNVLQRHTGCFSTIWLAATRGSRLVKREYLKVNVVKTCQEILDYVLVQVQPPMPGLPRPRFSLYLSAQLQIGVIRVYFQQCQYLVEDIQHTLERLHRAQMQIRIDMVDTDLPSLLLPNCLAMMETLEDAPDPFFGLMSVEPSLPSPFNIPQIRHLLESKTPERVPEEIPPVELPRHRKPETMIRGSGVWLTLPPPPLSLQRKAPSPGGPPARRRRRQLLFWDKETQISREKFQEQLQTRAHCWECPKVQPPKRMTRSPAELFRTPTLSARLPPELLSLWTHCARAPPRIQRPPTEVEEEPEIEGKKAETPSDIEVLREAQEPSGPLMLSSELSLEAAEEERSRTSLVPPEERWGWTEAEQPEPPALPVVPELPEMLMELPLELPPEPELLTLGAVHRAVALGLQANQKLDFSSLVPPLSPRKMAARVFYLLLVLCAQQIIRMEQEEPYGHILIQPGPKFYQG